jgi:hypothetical protein
MKANSPPICDNIVAVLFSLTQIIFCYTGCPKKKYSGLIRNNFQTSKAFKEK